MAETTSPAQNWRETAPGWLGEPWPANLTRADDGAMMLAGQRLDDLATEVGTPAYLVDENDFKGRARAYRDAFTQAFEAIGTKVALFYAGKANLNKTLARWAAQESFGIDTTSSGELTTALAAGVPGERIALHGNNKSREELEQAIAAGVGHIIVDSLPEIELVAEVAAAAGKSQPVLVRVTTGVHAGGHEYISTAHEDQKFGLSVNPAPGESESAAMTAVLKVLEQPSLELLGLHSHIGSQILDSAGFKAAAQALVKLAADIYRRRSVAIKELDLGGGFGIAYLPGQTSLDPRAAAYTIAGAVGDACHALGIPVPKIAFEPGRSLIGGAGITLYSVGTIKQVSVKAKDGTVFPRLYVSVDGGMSDNMRPMLYEAEYHAELANRVSDAPPVLARIVGKHCESGDILIRSIKLPGDIKRGDLIAVAATGAYGRSMASNYNMIPRPPVVAVNESGATVLVRRETVADILGLDQG
ncbi:MAG: diaminopimelate decarboxylase [Cellulomonadaceae bacterium]|jgi:diaminopimelate decarboxylase|nr:diaminopimelate decarboxylase [Cellulomonadaceae bacterium]